MRCEWVPLWLVMACAPAASQSQPSTPRAGSAAPEPANPAILAAFDRYDVVAMNAAHGKKDLDDFILTLIRDPRFPDKVNDIAVECGNSLYQPVLDRYIAGEDVPFADARKAWRNTTQEMCGFSGFYEQLFPLVRAINQKLPAAKRLRVLAGDPPIDWGTVKTPDEAMRFLDRDPAIATVMEKEVLSRHRKALMLFGMFHLMHGGSNAVSIYEKTYPDRTFVISDLGIYSPVTAWPDRSLLRTKGTPLGELSLKDIRSPLIRMRDCKVTLGFAPELEKPLAALVDAFLYLGPPRFALTEPIPAAIALDTDYMTELSRRRALMGDPGMPVESTKEIADEILEESQHPILEPPPPPDVKAMEQGCLEQQKQRAPR